MSDSRSDTSTKQPRHYTAVFVVLLLVSYGIDRWTKWLAINLLGDGSVHTVIPHVLSLRLIGNPGASLGMGSAVTPVLAVFAFIAAVVLSVAAVRATSFWWTVCLSLAASGAFGNFTDRVNYAKGFLDGHVVDFLDYGWSIGNVADIWLVIAAFGIVMLTICTVPSGLWHKTQSQDDDE